VAVRRIGDVELSEDMRHERREWTAQRVGWVLMALLVGAALAGAFGSGPLARARAAAPGLEVEYPRFARDDADAELTVRLAGGQLWLGRELLERFELELVTPPPDRVAMQGDRWIYDHGGAPAEVTLRVRPRTPGASSVRLGAVGGGEVRLEQLVYP
jgi:hypothetical protein